MPLCPPGTGGQVRPVSHCLPVKGFTNLTLVRQGLSKLFGPKRPCPLTRHWREHIKGNSSAQSGLAEEESRHVLQALAEEPLRFQTAEAPDYAVENQLAMGTEGDAKLLPAEKMFELDQGDMSGGMET